MPKTETLYLEQVVIAIISHNKDQRVGVNLFLSKIYRQRIRHALVKYALLVSV